ncbi:phage tail protein [Mucilaginibacter sp.]|jgi:microcystin-dependent protein|uniref:phage tail protein n=1 Tax=Mucilaginibacter sp. TaxID=1882438 RepID=UPI002630264B|nr:tail fiber protein [Mucilaginibacter sp.]MDB5126738.1 Tail Collar domain protein [Mucilaginibacter sp.]
MNNDEQFIGEIRMFSGDFAPKGWAFCNGAQFDTKKNTFLFSLLGYHFGDVSQRIARLPDLRSRVPINYGEIKRSEYYEVGTSMGTEKASASKSMPGHYKAGAPTQFKAAEVNHSIIQPVLAVNFIIALEGVYPPRP